MGTTDLTTLQWYVDNALAKLLAQADALVAAGGDGLLCRAPDIEGANSVFALVTHCCGVMERWGGEAIAGRPIMRDRAAEFTATGTIDELTELVATQRRRWEADLAGYEAGAAPRGPVPWDANDRGSVTQGSVALHVIEELYQHLGHVDLTVDLLTRAR